MVSLPSRICCATASRSRVIAASTTPSATVTDFARPNDRRDGRVLTDAVQTDPNFLQKLVRVNAEII